MAVFSITITGPRRIEAINHARAVYNTAAAQYLGLNKLTDAHWDKLAAALNPNQISLFTDMMPPAAPGDGIELQDKTPPSADAASADSYKNSTTPPAIATQPTAPVPTPQPYMVPPRPDAARPFARHW